MKWWLGCPSPTTQYVDALIFKGEMLCMLCCFVQHNRISAPSSEPLGVRGNYIVHVEEGEYAPVPVANSHF